MKRDDENDEDSYPYEAVDFESCHDDNKMMTKWWQNGDKMMTNEYEVCIDSKLTHHGHSNLIWIFFRHCARQDGKQSFDPIF